MRGLLLVLMFVVGFWCDVQGAKFLFGTYRWPLLSIPFYAAGLLLVYFSVYWAMSGGPA